jgi:hypothetical protein
MIVQAYHINCSKIVIESKAIHIRPTYQTVSPSYPPSSSFRGATPSRLSNICTDVPRQVILGTLSLAKGMTGILAKNAVGVACALINRAPGVVHRLSVHRAADRTRGARGP